MSKFVGVSPKTGGARAPPAPPPSAGPAFITLIDLHYNMTMNICSVALFPKVVFFHLIKQMPILESNSFDTLWIQLKQEKMRPRNAEKKIFCI